jgi:NADH:ubiquinone oxidoreductase subunit 6 (subunit J)
METVYVLAGLLLMALIFIEVSFSLPEKRQEQVKKLLKLDEAHLLEELGRATVLLTLCLISGLLLSGLYAVSAFAGAELQHISQWGLTHWVGAIIGLVVIVTITMSQSFAHSSQMHNAGRFVVILLLITFAIFSEISNPSEREEMKMAQKSHDSAVFQAVLGEIKANSNHQPDYSPSIAAAQATLAKHEFELGRCNRHADKGEKRVRRCEDHENNAIAQANAQIASYQQASIHAANQSSADKQALIQQAQGLERNTDNHSAIIKFLKTALNTDYQHAMILAALILVVAFEAGFGFAGYNVAMYKEALVQKGNKDILYDIEAKRVKAAHTFREKTGRYKRDMLTTQDRGSPDIAIKKADSTIAIKTKNKVENKANTVEKQKGSRLKTIVEKTEKIADSTTEKILDDGTRNLHQRAHEYFKKKEQPITAFTRNENTGTHEQNYDLFGAEKHKTDEQLKAEIAKIVTLKANSSNRSGTVAVNRTATVKAKPNKKLKKDSSKSTNMALYGAISSADRFDKMYRLIRADIIDKNITPSARSLANRIIEFAQNDKKIKRITVSIPECRHIANEVRKRLINEGIIKKNPNYKNGCAKYVIV